MNYMDHYQEWINSGIIDADNRNELKRIRSNHEIKDRFFKNLEFGTGGLRGIIGAGTNRINIYTIRKATQGLTEYIRKVSLGKDRKSVAIAYDSRHYSAILALESALVLAANNIKAFLFDALRPAPELSFAVRHLKCDAGIVITASHNPPEYNGYKVFGPDGGQITPSTADAIISEIRKLDIFLDVKFCAQDEALRQGLLTYVGEEIDKVYLHHISKLPNMLNISSGRRQLRIVYTPLHGAGLMLVCRALLMFGYKEVHNVMSQSEPDGDFPTVHSPNPEEREALTEGIALAEKINADIVLGTDPDADRLGVAVKYRGQYVLLTGNQIGALLTYYILSNKTDISSRDAVIKTIVTSELGAKIAKAYGATVINTLTGFKYIGEKIKEFDENGQLDFLFGYEESHGYLAGTFVRDKDAVIAIVLIVEMAAFYEAQGMTLVDVLDELQEIHGYFTDALENCIFERIVGQKQILSIINKFRDRKILLGVFSDIRQIEDYKTRERYDIRTSKIESIELPAANVIMVKLEDESWFAVRPSGTEPKLKIYYSAFGRSQNESNNRMIILKDSVSRMISSNYGSDTDGSEEIKNCSYQ